jgi:hypothetical protein
VALLGGVAFGLLALPVSPIITCRMLCNVNAAELLHDLDVTGQIGGPQNATPAARSAPAEWVTWGLASSGQFLSLI